MSGMEVSRLANNKNVLWDVRSFALSLLCKLLRRLSTCAFQLDRFLFTVWIVGNVNHFHCIHICISLHVSFHFTCEISLQNLKPICLCSFLHFSLDFIDATHFKMNEKNIQTCAKILRKKNCLTSPLPDTSTYHHHNSIQTSYLNCYVQNWL